MSNAQHGQFIIFSLPSFLKLEVTGYTLGAPPKSENKKAQGGMSNWILEGSDDPKNFQVLLDAQNDNKDLQYADAVKTFPIVAKTGFYQHFRLTQTGPNHQANLSIFLGRFDLSGKLIIYRK
jgi:hypothetical protein